jgi:hypothetical protein
MFLWFTATGTSLTGDVVGNTFTLGRTHGAGLQVSAGSCNGRRALACGNWTLPARIARDISTPPEYGSFSKGDVAVWAFAIVASESRKVMSKNLTVWDALVKIRLLGLGYGLIVSRTTIQGSKSGLRL